MTEHNNPPKSRANINRENAQKSTGPKTEAGKQKSALNATRHGLTAQSALLPSEDRDQYTAFTQQFFDEFNPQGPVETQLCQTLADCSWKTNRGTAWENHTLCSPTSEDFDTQVRTLTNLGLYQSRIFRMFEKALKDLKQLQAERRAAEQSALEEAVCLYRLEQAEAEAAAAAATVPPSPTESIVPEEDGFVFTPPATPASNPPQAATRQG